MNRIISSRVGRAPEVVGAKTLLDTLVGVAARLTDREVLGIVADPAAVPRSAADWKREDVRRNGRDYKAWVFEISAPVENLTPEKAWALLGHVAVDAHFAGRDPRYARIRFRGNRSAVGFWDADADFGVVKVGEKVQPLPGIESEWPKWHNQSIRLRQLTLVEPFVIEVSADVALSGHSFRHAVRFIRARPELDVDEVPEPDE